MKTTGLGILTAILATGASAQAADRYNLKIETGMVISESCTTADGQTQTSHIELLVEDSKASDPAQLTNGVARIRVCSPFSAPVRENVPMLIPVGLMRQIGKMTVGKQTGFDIKSEKFSSYFEKEPAPNYLIAEKTHDGIMQLTFIDKASKRVKIGPIRVFLGDSSTLASAKGYSAAKNLPISRLEVEVRDKGVTLEANLSSVDVSTRD